MTEAIETPNFAFQRLGELDPSSAVIEPRDWNKVVDALDSNLPQPAAYAHGITPAAGVTAAAAAAMFLKKVTITVVGKIATVADADDFGSVEILTLPDKNLVFVGAEVDLTLTKDGTGLLAATTLDAALGTAAASNTTLSGLMLNIHPKSDLDADDLAAVWKSHGLATTPVLTGVLDAATNKIYVNVAAVTEVGVAGTVTVDGVIDLYFLDLGNRTS